MKIAIPTNDQTTISGHFGRTKGFMIYEIENNEIKNKEYKENSFTHHHEGHHHEHGEHHHGAGHGHHSHAGIFKMLNDCKTVIAGGMGQRLYTELKAQNINVFMTRESNIENAINLFIDGKLDNNDDDCCIH